jgi:hypothetical protein
MFQAAIQLPLSRVKMMQEAKVEKQLANDFLDEL